jgi:hypothetical protein
MDNALRVLAGQAVGGAEAPTVSAGAGPRYLDTAFVGICQKVAKALLLKHIAKRRAICAAIRPLGNGLHELESALYVTDVKKQRAFARANVVSKDFDFGGHLLSSCRVLLDCRAPLICYPI